MKNLNFNFSSFFFSYGPWLLASLAFIIAGWSIFFSQRPWILVGFYWIIVGCRWFSEKT